MTAQIVDKLCLATALLAPVVLVWRLGWLGVVAGAVVSWIALIAAGVLLDALDSNRDAAIFDGVWLVFGLPACAVYAALIQAMSLLGRKLLGRRCGTP